MSSASYCDTSDVIRAAAPKAKFNPLRFLMDLWERDAMDDEDGDVDLSLMLSGMVGQQFFGPDQN